MVGHDLGLMFALFNQVGGEQEDVCSGKSLLPAGIAGRNLLLRPARRRGSERTD